MNWQTKADLAASLLYECVESENGPALKQQIKFFEDLKRDIADYIEDLKGLQNG